jgi:phosphoserine aminotransferase
MSHRGKQFESILAEAEALLRKALYVLRKGRARVDSCPARRLQPVPMLRSAPRAPVNECRSVPANYRVLFMQGGGTAQFAAVPLNLLAGGLPGLFWRRTLP